MLPALPNELWDRIFRFAAVNNETQHDWVHFWVLARQVSRTWRKSIAEAYLQVLLQYSRRCVIDFDCGFGVVKSMGKCFFGMEMLFDRMDPNDKKRIVFKEGGETQGNTAKDYTSMKYRMWRSRMEWYLGADEEAGEEGGRFDLTPYVISVYGASLDSELPGLRYDVEKREISFEWEEMLNAFCLEYAEVIKRRTSIIPRVQAMARGASTLSSKGLLEIMDIAMEGIVGNRRSSLRNVRRHRILKFYKEQHNFITSVDLIDKEHEEEQLLRIESAEGAGVGRDDGDGDLSDEHADDSQDEDTDFAETGDEDDESP